MSSPVITMLQWLAFVRDLSHTFVVALPVAPGAGDDVISSSRARTRMTYAALGEARQMTRNAPP
jgi:hypothetical protein